VYDARALRVIVDDVGGARLGDAIQTCYRLVAAVHKLWRPIANEYDDYISNVGRGGWTGVWAGFSAVAPAAPLATHMHASCPASNHPAPTCARPPQPKPSGYQALHTAVWGPGGAALEVQIKTSAMHEDAEFGGAAHWAYKEGGMPAAGAPAAAAAGGGGSVGSSAGALWQRALTAGSGSGGGLGGAALDAPAPVPAHAPVAAAVAAAAAAAEPGPGERAPTLVVAAAAARPVQQQQQQQPGQPGSREPQRQALSAVALAPARPAAEEAAAAGAPQQQPQHQEAAELEEPVPHIRPSSRQARPQPPLPVSQPPPQPGAAAYPGQPILRVSHCLRAGVVLACGPDAAPAADAAEALGPSLAAAGGAEVGSGSSGVRGSAAEPVAGGPVTRITVVIQNGGTPKEHPLRHPDYAFYASLAAYARDHGWARPGQGDLRARVEEFVLCRDGRWHRRDHLGYTHPDTTLTLLEGYEAEAAAAAGGASAAGAAAAALEPAASAPEGAASAGAAPAPAAPRRAAPIAAAAAAAGLVSDSAGGAMAAAAAAAAAAEEQARWQEQWRATAAKAARLRSVIEWGQDLAEGFEAPARNEEVSVLIWPGGVIECVFGGAGRGRGTQQGPAASLLPARCASRRACCTRLAADLRAAQPRACRDVPRGTTAGELFRRKGVLTIEGADGDGASGSATALSPAPASGSRAGGARRFNVNNRLVEGDTQLEDGDLVILAQHVLKI
jgi:hypothetical protein